MAAILTSQYLPVGGNQNEAMDHLAQANELDPANEQITALKTSLSKRGAQT